MDIIRNIQNYFRNSTLKSKLQLQKAMQRKRVNFEEAQTVGLIFDATDNDKRQTALSSSAFSTASRKAPTSALAISTAKTSIGRCAREAKV